MQANNTYINQNTNATAYDLDYFAKSETKKPRLYVAKHAKNKNNLKGYNKSLFKTIFIATVLITLVSAVLYMQSVDTALTGEIAKQEQALLELESEYGYLNNEIEMKTNLINVESYAIQQLGLVKRDSAQTVYLYRDGGTQITYQKTVWQEIIGMLSNSVQNISAYIPSNK